MRSDLLTSPVSPHADSSIVVVGFGPFAGRVLHMVQQEFVHRGVPAEHALLLAFDTVAGRRSEPPGPGDVRLDARDTGAYLAAPGNETLRAAVAHVPPAAWPGEDAMPIDLPALGFVTFHRYDETLVTSRMRAALEALRARNPQHRIRCVVVAGLGDGVAAGMFVPFLFRVRDLLRHLKVHLDVVLATSEASDEGPAGASAAHQRNCVAQAMLWEAMQNGSREFVYPGKDGVREERRFRGPIAPVTYVYSGGVGDTSYGEAATASTIATCIVTLALTRLGDDLEHRYDEARTIAGESGATKPSFAILNVGGIQLHTFRSLFRLRAVRALLTGLTRTPDLGEAARMRAAATAFRDRVRLSDGSIAEVLGLGARPFTHDEVAAARLPQEKLHDYVTARLEEDVGGLMQMASGGVPNRTTESLLDGARASIAAQGHELVAGPGASVAAAVLFFGTLEKEFDASRQAVLERAGLARLELGRTPDRERLDVLLERLRRDTTLQGARRAGTPARFAATVNVSVSTQLRKIMEVAAEIRAHALILAQGAILSEIYARLARFCEQQREELQGRLYVLNQLAARCARTEELTQRATRGALTYQRTRCDALVERLWEKTRAALPVPAPPEVVARLGGDWLAFRADAPEALERLVQAMPVDEARLAAAVDASLAADPEMTTGLREAQAQLFPAAQIDRDARLLVDNPHSRFVLCTRGMYEAHAGDLFEGYDHLETDEPYEVLLVQPESGLRFMALAYLRRIQAAYLALPAAEQSLGHLTADLAAQLPALES
jgi:hypothetical protein